MDSDSSDSFSTDDISIQNHEVLEATLFATIHAQYKDMLVERLKEMMDPICTKFSELETLHVLRLPKKPDVHLRARQRFRSDVVVLCYTGTPIENDELPAVCRSSIFSIIHSKNLFELLYDVGFRYIREWDYKGMYFTRGPIKVLLYKVDLRVATKTKGVTEAAKYNFIVEASIPIENNETMKYSKLLKDFTDQFLPLIEFRKVKYWIHQENPIDEDQKEQ